MSKLKPWQERAKLRKSKKWTSGQKIFACSFIIGTMVALVVYLSIPEPPPRPGQAARDAAWAITHMSKHERRKLFRIRP